MKRKARKARQPKHRQTIAGAVRAAPSSGLALAHAIHGPSLPPPLVAVVGRVMMLQAELDKRGTPQGRREFLQQRLCEARNDLATLAVEAVKQGDHAALAAAAKIVKHGPDLPADVHRTRLLILKRQTESKAWPDGTPCLWESVSAVADAVGWRAPLRVLRRTLRDLDFPVRFGNASPRHAGERRRERTR